MAKIGIITFQRAHNFGAQMQMYALYKFLQKKGNDVWVLDYYCPAIEDPYIKEFRPIKKYFSKNIYHNVMRLYYDLKGHFLYHPKKQRAFENFLTNNFQLTNRFENPQDLPTDFDILITGSDQVWNYNLTGGKKEPYFLDNGKEDNSFPRRISYAPSTEKVQFDTLYNDRYYLKNILGKYYWVSTREKSLASFLNETIGIQAEPVIDPTFLLSREDYLEVAVKPKLNHYLCLYRVAPSDTLFKIAEIIAKERNLSIIYTHSADIATDKAGMYGPLEMLGLLCYADVIVTSSFHGTAFSIINRKDFYAVCEKPSSRISDMLNALNICDRILTCESSYNGFSSVNYDENAITQYIAHSKDLLLKALQ